MRLIPFRVPAYVAGATFALLMGGAASAGGFQGAGGGFHGGGVVMHGAGAFQGGGGFHGAPQFAPRQGAAALPPRGQWVGNDGFGGPGHHWSPGHRGGHGMAHQDRWPGGEPLHHRRHYGHNPYLEGYGVGYLGGGAYSVGYYGGNGAYYVDNFYAYTDDIYRPTAYTAASGYAPIYGEPVYFDLTADQPVVPSPYRPAVISEPGKPLPHIIDLTTAKESPNVIR